LGFSGVIRFVKGSEEMNKERECDHCGKVVKVPDNLDDDIAVFCSKKCSYAEAGW